MMHQRRCGNFVWPFSANILCGCYDFFLTQSSGFACFLKEIAKLFLFSHALQVRILK